MRCVSYESPRLVPVARAVQQGIRFSFVTPATSVLGAPGDPDKGEVFCVGDDNVETVGPSGSSPLTRALIQQRIEAGGRIILVACAPLTSLYQEAADAALSGENVVLIEARRETQTAWSEHIRQHAKIGAAVGRAVVDPNNPDPDEPVVPGEECTASIVPAFLAFGPGIFAVAPATAATIEAKAARREKFLDDLHEQLEAGDDGPTTFWISAPEPERRTIKVHLASRGDLKRRLRDPKARRRKLGLELAERLMAFGL